MAGEVGVQAGWGARPGEDSGGQSVRISSNSRGDSEKGKALRALLSVVIGK